MTMKVLGVSSLVAMTLLAAAIVSGQVPETNRETAFTRTAAAGRKEMEALERHLERAVAEVSVSHAGILLGRADSSRGYRLPGYGIIFVLTPRALPGNEKAYVLRAHPREGREHPGPRREVEVVTTTEVEEIEALERQVLILQHAAEAHRRAAEEDHARIARRVRIHLGPASEKEENDDEEPGLVDETAPLPPDLPTVLPAPPPWRFWFETGSPGEERTPERVVEDVREAVIGVLETRGPGVVGLEADEFVTVAVDFVPGDFFSARPRPSRTLIVRARHKDLAARGRGALAREDLRARVEVIEY
jgi:hypothetical protein